MGQPERTPEVSAVTEASTSKMEKTEVDNGASKGLRLRRNSSSARERNGSKKYWPRMLRRLVRAWFWVLHFGLDKWVRLLLFLSKYLRVFRGLVRKQVAMPLRRMASSAYAKSRRLPQGKKSEITVMNSSFVTKDEVELFATLYLPVDADHDGVEVSHQPLDEEHKFPCILVRTPYGRETLGPDQAQFFCEHGYAVLLQDTRGRFGSSGDFFPVKHEIVDGGETIDWIKTQPWSDGKIVLYGVSYLGLTTYAAAGSRMQDVSGMVPVMTCAKTHALLYHSGDCLSLDLILRWLWLAVKLMNTVHSYKFFVPGMQGELNECFLHAPLSTADTKLMGKQLDFVQEALDAPNPNHEFWKDKNVLCEMDHVNRPAMHLVGGWYDFFLKQSFEDFQTSVRGANGKAAKFTIGSWHHWQVASYSPPSIRLALDFFDRILGRKPSYLAEETDADRSDIHVSVIGTHNPCLWLGLKKWPPPAAAEHSLEFVSLTERSASCYTFDPLNPTPYVGGPSFDIHNNGRKDQSSLEQRSDVMTFTSQVVRDDMWVCGDVFVELHAVTSNPNTDFFFKLCDVDENGTSFNVVEGIHRCTPVDFAPSCQELLAHGEYEIRGRFKVGPIACVFAAGHRFRLQVSGGAHPLYCRNFGVDAKNVGKSFAFVESHEMRPADHTICHDSRLILPCVSLAFVEHATITHPAYPDADSLV